MDDIKILKGNIIYTKTKDEFEICEQGYLVCKDGKVEGIYQTLPFRLGGEPIENHGDCLIIPGMTDLHIHAPQYTFRGTGMDLELLEWLETNTFPEEAKYKDVLYANETYAKFAKNLKHSSTTRACVFGTIHRRSTPRFIPSCTDELLDMLKMVQMRYQIPVQSHLSENLSEIEWVKELCPYAEFYGDAYDHFGLFGADASTVMAHCVYSTEEEIQRMKENGVYVAHCPESNENLSSGIAPVKRYLEEGLSVGLGSDVAGGSTENLFRAMAYAIQMSKMRWRLVDQKYPALKSEEAFYMATKGGGSFFGKVGSFEEGYEFDAVVLDDSRLESSRQMSVKDRLERMIYLADEREVKAKYVRGNKII
ncbi:MAG: amidohydrolase family protein [Clostridiales bacterium]|nr:amidohydrolase family protein [Clostridiales bacterium]